MKAKIIFIVFVVVVLFNFSNAFASEEYIVKFNTDISKHTDASEMEVINADRRIYKVKGLECIERLHDCVEYFEENGTVELIDEEKPPVMRAAVADSVVSQLRMVNVGFAHQLCTYGNEVRVAVIDSGCNSHVDLAGNLAGGYNFIEKNENYADTYNHGTHVAGIIAAEMNDRGVVGIAPKARIYALKCFEERSGSLGDIAAAIYDAIDVFHCDVINMSFSHNMDSSVVREAVKYAAGKGAILVAAAGNNAKTPMFPAHYPEVIGVGSVAENETRSSFSPVNTGSVDVVACGEDVYSSIKMAGYGTRRGTSQATPQIAGAAALMLSAYPDMTSAEFRSLLTETAKDLGEEGYDGEFGYGLMDIRTMFMKKLESNPYYVSPRNDGSLLIYNGSGEELNAVAMCAAYSGSGKLTELTSVPIALESGQSINMDVGTSELDRFFLWEPFGNPRPLFINR